MAIRKSLAVIASCLFFSTLALAGGTPGITGTYIGQYFFQVNSHTNSDAWEAADLPPGTPGTPPTFYLIEGEDGTWYNRVAYSVHQSYWEWDFDNKEVRLSPTRAFAMETQFVHPFPRSFAYQRVDRQTRPPAPDETPLHDLTATLTDHGDGTYTLRHSMQFYFEVPNYPVAYVNSLFRITQDPETSQLEIVALPSPTNEENPDYIPLNAGIPGTLTGQTLPFLVALQFSAPVMYPNTPHDCNNNGLTDAESRLLGLNPCDENLTAAEVASRIGPYPFFPKDSNQNGIYDIWEDPDREGTERIQIHPLNGKMENHIAVASNLKMQNGEFISLVAPDGDYFFAGHDEGQFINKDPEKADGQSVGGIASTVIPPDFLDILPKTEAEARAMEQHFTSAAGTDKPLDWSMGRVFFRMSHVNTSLSRYKQFRAPRVAIWDNEQAISNAETRIPNLQAQIEALDPEDPQYHLKKANFETQIEAQEANIQKAEFILPLAQADRQPFEDSYRDEGIEIFGSDEFLSWEKNFLTAMPTTRIPVDRRTITSEDPFWNGEPVLNMLSIMRIEFPMGVPEGLVIRKVELGVLDMDPPVEVANYPKLPSADVVLYRVVDEHTVEVRLRGMGATEKDYTQIYQSRYVGDPEINAGVYYILAIGHTEEDRFVDYSHIGAPDPVDPDPEEPSKKSSSGGTFGWIPLLGLAALALRRR